MASSFRYRYIAGLAALTGLAACSSAPTSPTSATTPAAASALSTDTSGSSRSLAVDGIASLGEFEVCKRYSGTVGPAVSIAYTVDFNGDGSTEISNSVQLSDGQCAVVHTYQDGGFNGLQVQRVTVTEQVPSGYTPSYTKTTALLSGTTTIGPVAGNSVSGDMQGNNPDNGFLVVFTNTADPIESGTGRFTGGGTQTVVGVAKVSRGLTIHCDRLLSNNLEVTWGGNSFHMTDHLTTVACTDDPNIDQNPPKAPLDTLIGTGIGRYNNVDGYTIAFTLVDGGEPGRHDKAALSIYPTGNPGGAVLNVPLQALTTGNLQAHYDQPHR